MGNQAPRCRKASHDAVPRCGCQPWYIRASTGSAFTGQRGLLNFQADFCDIKPFPHPNEMTMDRKASLGSLFSQGQGQGSLEPLSP